SSMAPLNGVPTMPPSSMIAGPIVYDMPDVKLVPDARRTKQMMRNSYAISGIVRFVKVNRRVSLGLTCNSSVKYAAPAPEPSSSYIAISNFTNTAAVLPPPAVKSAANENTSGRVSVRWRWFRPAGPPGCVPMLKDDTPGLPVKEIWRPPPLAPFEYVVFDKALPSAARLKNRGLNRWFVRTEPPRFGPWYVIVSSDATT